MFELSPVSGGYSLTTLFAFDANSQGAQPYGTLVLEPSGDIFWYR